MAIKPVSPSELSHDPRWCVRQVRDTRSNAASSRSHLILRIHIDSRPAGAGKLQQFHGHRMPGAAAPACSWRHTHSTDAPP